MCQAAEWMTLLSIHSESLTQVEAVNLAGLKNLAGLYITADPSTPLREAVHDGVIRSWSRSVKDDGAFPKLRVVGLSGWEGVTMKSLAYLSDFPALVFLDLADTSITREDFIFANLRGWYCQSGHESQPDPFKSSRTLLSRFQEVGCALARRHGLPHKPDTLPILYMSLGVGGWILDAGGGKTLFLQRLQEDMDRSACSEPQREEQEEQVGPKRKRLRQEEKARKQIRLSKRQSMDKILGDFARNP